MAGTPIDERRFTDVEVREMLRRAVERGSPTGLSRREGLSLAELKAIGQEAGIDPARMEAAAREVALHGGRRVNPLIGAPTLLGFERTVDGEIDPDDAPRVLSIIRTVMGHQGEVADIRGSLEWSARTDVGEHHVTVWSRDGRTTIQAGANLSGRSP